MPKKPRNPEGPPPNSRGPADAEVNDEFWDRSRKTRKEDRKSSKRRRAEEPKGDKSAAGSPTMPVETFSDVPPPEPRPARPPADPPTGRPAGERRRPLRPPAAPAPPGPSPGPRTAPTRSVPEPPSSAPGFRSPRRRPAAGGPAGRPAMSSRTASGRAPGGSPAAAPLDPPSTDLPPTGPAAVPPSPARPRRPSGEVPSLDARLEGLASRGRLNLAASPDDDVALDHDDTYTDDSYDDDYDGGVPRRRGWSRLAIALLVVAGLFIAAVVATGLWVRGKLDPAGPPGDVVTVEVVEGQSTSDIGQLLQDNGVITSATVWTWYVRFKGGGDIQAGTYDLRESMSMGEALAALQVDPIPQERSVTIAEGLTIEQMIARLTDPEDGVRGFDADRLRQAMTDGQIRSQYLPEGQANPEGTLFPETYSLGEEDDEVALVQRMVTQMDTVLTGLEVDARAQALGRTPYEILTIASMIEEEARVAEERPQMARVIYNRLAEGMPLGIDPTSCYESGQCPPTSAELESDSPYNTRRNPGLPPTPISSPSRASIEAALAPAEGDWLFFVLNDSAGHHTFSNTEEEHAEAVQYCRDQGLCG